MFKEAEILGKKRRETEVRGRSPREKIPKISISTLDTAPRIAYIDAELKSGSIRESGPIFIKIGATDFSKRGHQNFGNCVIFLTKKKSNFNQLPVQRVTPIVQTL